MAKKRYSASEKTNRPVIEKTSMRERPFVKMNFILMGICLAMIVLGFVLMGGGGSSVETGFNPDIFSTRRIVVGPTISFLGFLLMAFAIIYSPKQGKGEQKEQKS